MEQVFYNVPDDKCFIMFLTNAEKCCSMLQYFTGSQTKNTSAAAFACFTVLV